MSTKTTMPSWLPHWDLQTPRLPEASRLFLVLVGVLATRTAPALDANSPEVIGAYEGPATEAKLDTALAGFESLVEALRVAPSGGPNGFAYFSATFANLIGGFGTSLAFPLTTLNAASDSDLGARGAALLLDQTLLNVLGDFSSDRAVTIGAGGATIDTQPLASGGAHSLELNGNMTAVGQLVIKGDGTVAVNGNNIWHVAPHVASGVFRGDSHSLATNITSSVGPSGSFALFHTPPTVEIFQTSSGVYERVISGGARFIKSGAGDLIFSHANTYVGGTSIVGGRLILGTHGRINSGGLSLATGTTFDISQALGSNGNALALSVGVLSGDGQITLGNNSIGISTFSNGSFDGEIFGAGGIALAGNGSSPRMTFTSPQHYAGGTRIDNATLALSGLASLARESVLSLGGGGVFDISDADGNREVASLDGSGVIQLGAHTLTFGSDTLVREFSGNIVGSGGLNKVGAGTQILQGQAQYSGNTTVSGGILSVTPSALGPSVTNHAELEFRFAQANHPTLPIAAYSGDISGTGKVSKTGDGVVWFRGSNRYTGGTEIRSGALIGNSASLQGSILVNDAVAAFYQIDEGTYAGNLSGNGLLLKYGPGRLQLAGVNVHTGGTAFSGPLRITSDAALGASGGSVGIIDGALEIETDITSDRAFLFAGEASIDTNGFDFTLQGETFGSGALTKLGLGQLTLNGNQAYTGLTRVASGQLHLLGNLAGDVAIDPNARLSGSGTINGDLSLSAGSVYAVAVDAGGHAERLTVGGSAALQGATLEVNAADGTYRARTRYTVLSAAGGINGQFAATTTNLAFLEPALTYDNTNVELTLARNDIRYSDLAITPSQISFGGALDGLEQNASGDALVVMDALRTLTTSEVGPALDAIGGIALTSVPRALQAQSRGLSQQISSRLGALQNAPSVASFADEFDRGVLLAMNDADAARALPVYAAALSAASAQTMNIDTRSGFWVRGLGGAGNFDITPTTDAELRTVGVLGGFDYQPTTALTLGLLASYTDSELEQGTPRSDTEVTSWRVGGYGRWQPSRFHVDALASYGGDHFETTRHLAIGPLERTARGDFDGHTYNTYLETGYTQPWATLSPLRVQPYIATQWTSQRHDTYSETGAGAVNLIVQEATTDSLRSLAGVRLQYACDTVAGAVNAELRGAWAHEFADVGHLSARLAGDRTGILFQAQGSSIPRDSALVGAGVMVQKDRHWRVFADVDAELNSAQETFGVSVGVRYSW